MDTPREPQRILQPGRNCWRIAHAHRFAMLVDADDYFRSVRSAIRQARHSVIILGWDIDSRTVLVPGGADDGYPEPLGDFLHAVLASRPELRVHVLNWDFAMLYALEREWLPVYKAGWRAHPRLSFRMDGRHPIGGSHHQKVVVVDDELAFSGGLDLTGCRWDTREHAASAPLRRDVNGKPYAPFHDVQAMVDGDAARVLGDLARQRWQRCCGEILPAPPGESNAIDAPRTTLWPSDIAPDIEEIDVAVSRTEPAFEGRAGVHEVRQLHLDAIAAAREALFFENQYFTSGLIANALGQRLSEPEGPEVVVISPELQSGWLEEATMGVLRARMQKRLQAANLHQRYLLCCPHLPGLEDGCLNVHSKVFAVDDSLFCVGSANLSNRSMALDTECCLTIEAHGHHTARIRRAIAHLRNRLLGEHLDTAPGTVAATIAAKRSLIGAIDSLRTSGQRALHAFHPVSTPELDALIPEQAMFDPERPIEPDKLIRQFVPHEARKPAPRRLIAMAALGLVLGSLAIAWHATPLKEWVNLAALITVARSVVDMPWAPLAVVAAYVLGGLVMLPVMLLIAVSGVVFGPFLGALYAIAGSMASATVAYGIGWWLGRDLVGRMLGPRINRLSRRIAKRGILAMMVVRMVPVAPFTVVNMVAGASHIRFRDYLIGTLLGMAPGIFITVTFVHNLAEVVRSPSAGTVGVLAAVVAALIAFGWLLQRLLAHRRGVGA
jgi:phospholipase D1/2